MYYGVELICCLYTDSRISVHAGGFGFRFRVRVRCFVVTVRVAVMVRVGVKVRVRVRFRVRARARIRPSFYETLVDTKYLVSMQTCDHAVTKLALLT